MLILTLLPSYSFPFAIESDQRLEISLAEVALQREERRLRKNHFGEEWHDGLNFQAALLSRLSFGERLTLTLEPVWTSPREGREVYFRKGSVRLVLFNMALIVGRDSLWWGPGRHGALLVSNNAFPFDMIHLGSASPFYLPGVFSRLGRFEAEAFLTQLEKNRDFPRARLLGLRLVYRPVDEITVGFSRITMFGGEGRPDLTPIDLVKLYFNNPNKGGKYEVNELAGVDLRLLPPVGRIFPGHTLELYGEYGGEDEAGMRPSKPALLAGLKWRYRELKVTIEHANNHLQRFPDVWYNHTVYTSGYTYRGQIIGHHMGSDAKDLYLRLETPLLGRWTGGADFEHERRHLSSPLQEQERRWGGDVTFADEAGHAYSARFIYEQIKNLNLLPGNERNLYGIVTARWRF